MCIRDRFYDVTTLFKNAECLQEMLDTLYEMYKDKGITKVVGIESVSYTHLFPMAYSFSLSAFMITLLWGSVSLFLYLTVIRVI